VGRYALPKRRSSWPIAGRQRTSGEAGEGGIVVRIGFERRLKRSQRLLVAVKLPENLTALGKSVRVIGLEDQRGVEFGIASSLRSSRTSASPRLICAST
jgi:hypothetical protein